MMTQQLASSAPIEGLLDFGPKGAPEGAVEGDPFSQILAQFTGLPTADGAAPVEESGEASAAAMLKLAAGLSAKAGEGAEGEELADADSDAADTEEAQLPLLAALMAPTLPPQIEAAPAKAGGVPMPTPQTATPAIALSLSNVETTPTAPQDPALAGEDLSVALKALLPELQGRKEGTKTPRLPAGMAQASESLPASLDKTDSGASDLPPAAAGTGPLMQAPLDAAQSATVPLALAADMTAGPANADAAKVDAALPAQQLVERHLDLAHEGEWLDRLARDIAHSAGGDGSLRFRLNPEHLGSLHVELTQGAAGASLRLTADSEAARAIIADAQPRLVAEARAHGVKIAETHVDLGGREQSFQGQSFQGQSFAGDQRGQRHLRGEEYLTTFKPEPSDGAVTRRTARHASDRYA